MGERLHVGKPTTLEAYADRSPYAAVFEDDGESAYFYGLDTRLGTQPVLDAVHVYNVCALLDRQSLNEVEIRWSPDQQRVALLLNGEPHACFDFQKHRAYCRSNFPPSSSWSQGGHTWEDGAVDFLAG
ncbi:MAG TPA: DUF2251 domain-containing protein [Gemmatimonadaceae bacterium]|nr:DUF2251 domain-containing protein [Gemmatimonadaceae bacterium]